jgi:hypothetical protein
MSASPKHSIKLRKPRPTAEFYPDSPSSTLKSVWKIPRWMNHICTNSPFQLYCGCRHRLHRAEGERWSTMVAVSASVRGVSDASESGGEGVFLTGEDEWQNGWYVVAKWFSILIWWYHDIQLPRLLAGSSRATSLRLHFPLSDWFINDHKRYILLFSYMIWPC